MKANLLNDDMSVDSKWLKENINKEICSYIQDCGYLLNNLNDYNENLSDILDKTDMAMLLSNLQIYEVDTGIFIENLSPGFYDLRYYSYNKDDNGSMVNKDYLKIM